MFKVEIVQDEHQEGVRWLKASHNGVAWSLIEFRNDEEALQIITALQQSVQSDEAMRFCPECGSSYSKGKFAEHLNAEHPLRR